MSVEHVKSYLKSAALLVALVPLHELLHAGVCVVTGGQVIEIGLFSHQVCGGTVNNLALYDGFNQLNQYATSSLMFAYGFRVHHRHVFRPAISRLRRRIHL